MYVHSKLTCTYCNNDDAFELLEEEGDGKMEDSSTWYQKGGGE